MLSRSVIGFITLDNILREACSFTEENNHLIKNALFLAFLSLNSDEIIIPKIVFLTILYFAHKALPLSLKNIFLLTLAVGIATDFLQETYPEIDNQKNIGFTTRGVSTLAATGASYLVTRGVDSYTFAAVSKATDFTKICYNYFFPPAPKVEEKSNQSTVVRPTPTL